MSAENLDFTGIRSPDRPASSESPYRIRYPGSHSEILYMSSHKLYESNSIFFLVWRFGKIKGKGHPKLFPGKTATKWKSSLSTAYIQIGTRTQYIRKQGSNNHSNVAFELWLICAGLLMKYILYILILLLLRRRGGFGKKIGLFI
jgi:hypothetical protein